MLEYMYIEQKQVKIIGKFYVKIFISEINITWEVIILLNK